MIIPITTILSIINQAGVGDIVTKVMEQNNKADKLKLKVISILLDKMDDTGMCKVKDVITELVEKERVFDFDIDGFDSLDSD